MLKIISLIVFNIFSSACLAQENDSLYVIKAVHKNEMYRFIDSLKKKIEIDTFRFKRSDLIFSSIGALNKNPYSPLFIVNNRHKYRLDIVSGQKVLEFINEFLRSDKIQRIIMLNDKAGSVVYGDLGKKGAVLIDLKKSKGTNFYVAGFKMHKDVKFGGNNFNQ